MITSTDTLSALKQARHFPKKMKLRQEIVRGLILSLILIAGSLLLVTAINPITAEAVRWRTRLISLKIKGALPLSWTDTLRALGPGSMRSSEGRIEAAVAAGLNRNPFSTVRNPRTSEADVEAGGKTFRSDCAPCHGPTGGSASILTAGGFRQGSSDWALFQTISCGVPGTAMVGSKLPEDSIWQVIAFMRHAVLRPGAESNQSDQLACESSKKMLSVTPVSFDRLEHARQEPGNWLTYSGDYYSQRYSQLREINSRNVRDLNVKWVFQMPTVERKVQATPLVVDGIMYLTEPPGNVLALDVETGQRLWSYQRHVPNGLSLCCGKVNRGLAILGSRVFLGTLDAHLVALDAKTGHVDWDVKVADNATGHTITAAPLAVKDLIVVGIAGGEFGIRGFLDAYSASTGKRVWRFYTVPGPGETGHETWAGDSWKTGGAPTWLTGSYDSRLNFLYWGVGNPGPSHEGEGRAGDNLYSNCVVALDADTGKLKWYFQFMPHDEYGWDSVHIPVLLDTDFRGRQRQLMIWANRNAFYYVLDRQTGEFLLGREFATQSWAEGIDSKGRPIVKPNSSPTPQGTLIRPEGGGATNWWSPSYSPSTALFYVPVREDSASLYFKGPVEYNPGRNFTGSSSQTLPVETGRSVVRALDPKTGEMRWEARLPSDATTSEMGGLLSTAGNLVFGGNSEQFFALDATSGKILWHLGGKVVAAPVTYMSKGRQQVSVAIGRSIFTFALS